MFRVICVFMQSIEAIFDKLGGTGKAAAAINVKPTAASEMKRRKSIPVKYWDRVIAACKKQNIRGISYETLVKLHSGDKGAA